jgi:hypothetical protein
MLKMINNLVAPRPLATADAPPTTVHDRIGAVDIFFIEDRVDAEERQEVKKIGRRLEMLQGNLEGIKKERQRELIEKWKNLFVMVVDKDFWNANAGSYGKENERLFVERMADVVGLLKKESSLGDSELEKHRDKHLDANNEKLIGYKTMLTDPFYLLVIFETTEYPLRMFARGPFRKQLHGHGVFTISRDTETGEFALPELEQVMTLVNKSKPRSFETKITPIIDRDDDEEAVPKPMTFVAGHPAISPPATTSRPISPKKKKDDARDYFAEMNMRPQLPAMREKFVHNPFSRLEEQARNGGGGGDEKKK